MRRLALALFFAALSSDIFAAESALVVVVHADRTTAMTKEDLARIYLKKKRFWEDGSAIVPINRESRSEARETFEQRVLLPEESDLVAYWNQRYFHGVFPPATLTSDIAVKRYVASEPKAIGYISADAVDDSVRVVLELSSESSRR